MTDFDRFFFKDIGLRCFSRKIKYFSVYFSWLLSTFGVARKDIRSKRKFFRQAWPYNFVAFWYFSKIFFHHKWNKVWFLVIKGIYMSCLSNILCMIVVLRKNNLRHLSLWKTSFWRTLTFLVQLRKAINFLSIKH